AEIIGSALLLVHGQHALGDEEPAEDVHARKDERDKAEPAGRPLAGHEIGADRQKRTHHDHRGDRVGDRHQRGVQRRGDAPDDVIADEDRQNEDRKEEKERIDDSTHHWPPSLSAAGFLAEAFFVFDAAVPALAGASAEVALAAALRVVPAAPVLVAAPVLTGAAGSAFPSAGAEGALRAVLRAAGADAAA